MSFKRKACATLSMQAWQTMPAATPVDPPGRERSERENSEGQSGFQNEIEGFQCFILKRRPLSAVTELLGSSDRLATHLSH